MQLRSAADTGTDRKRRYITLAAALLLATLAVAATALPAVAQSSVYEGASRRVQHTG